MVGFLPVIRWRKPRISCYISSKWIRVVIVKCLDLVTILCYPYACFQVWGRQALPVNSYLLRLALAIIMGPCFLPQVKPSTPISEHVSGSHNEQSVLCNNFLGVISHLSSWIFEDSFVLLSVPNHEEPLLRWQCEWETGDILTIQQRCIRWSTSRCAG